jgi:hypothetical protein
MRYYHSSKSTILSLPRLIQKIDRFYFKSFNIDNKKFINLNFESEWAYHNKIKNIFDSYHGDDWRSHISYGQPYELQLVSHIPLYLVGLNRDVVYPINQSSIVKMLEDTYIPSTYFFNCKNTQYTTTNINNRSHIRAKEYTSFLLLHLETNDKNKK